jgi:electron transfer flavoprotein alpha/beta subunit
LHVAKALAKVAKDQKFDVVFVGKQVNYWKWFQLKNVLGYRWRR